MSAPSSQRTVTIVIVTLAAAFFGLIFLAIIGVGLYFGLKSIKPSGSIATTQAVSGTSAKGSITGCLFLATRGRNGAWNPMVRSPLM